VRRHFLQRSLLAVATLSPWVRATAQGNSPALSFVVITTSSVVET
jgi:hypothetical protein